MKRELIALFAAVAATNVVASPFTFWFPKVIASSPAPAPAGGGLLTEGADTLVTEAGDRIITE